MAVVAPKSFPHFRAFDVCAVSSVADPTVTLEPQRPFPCHSSIRLSERRLWASLCITMTWNDLRRIISIGIEILASSSQGYVQNLLYSRGSDTGIDSANESAFIWKTRIQSLRTQHSWEFWKGKWGREFELSGGGSGSIERPGDGMPLGWQPFQSRRDP